MIIRHAEKPLDDGPPHGVTVDGEPDPESLTPRGWQRAGALVGLFAPGWLGGTPPRLPTPTHLFASLIASGSASKRPRETLLPLAARLGLDVDSRFAKEQTDDLAAAVRATGGVVLVAWEHHKIPSIVAALGCKGVDVPTGWPDDRYDVVWVLEASAGGDAFTFRQVAEMLLAGDGPLVFDTDPRANA